MEPAIFGTLLERALEKKERSRLGAHYTPRSYVERLVRPVVMEPLREEWLLVETEVNRLLVLKDGQEEPTKAQRDKAGVEIRAFLERLQGVRILDPACGSGNFLYVTLDLIKTLEQEVQMRLLDVLGKVTTDLLEEFDPRLAGRKQVNPSQFLGIEINPRAAAIAELVIWIGYLQWHFKRYGTTPPPEPILQDFHNIEFRDAVLAYDGRELDVDAKTGKVRSRWGGRTMRHPVTGEDVPDPSDQVPIYRYINPRPAVWQEADYIVSNPPFIGNKRMKAILDEGYVDILRSIHSDVSESSDFVMYWWNHAAKLIQNGQLKRFGFITTNSITQISNRKVIEQYLTGDRKLSIILAIPDHPWTEGADGAAVRIAITGVELSNKNHLQPCRIGTVAAESKDDTPEDEADTLKITWQNVDVIFSNLRSGSDTSSNFLLIANRNICNVGVALHGQGFVVPETIAHDWINSYSDITQVVKPTRNGKDIMDKSRNQFVIDFYGLSLEEASKFSIPHQWILERVFPSREVNNRKSYRDNWWIFGEPRTQLRHLLQDINRYIVTPMVAKHRIFQFFDKNIIPDQKVVCIGLDDAYALGILSSKVHVDWSLACGSQLVLLLFIQNQFASILSLSQMQQ